MDLRQFFKKIREVEAAIGEPFPFVVSLETGDGGKCGVISEVPRYQAARTIVEGKARAASEEEIRAYLEQRAASQKQLEELETARRLHLNLFMTPEPRPAQTPVKVTKR